MGHKFAELTFTPNAKAAKEQRGSRSSNFRMEIGETRNERLGSSEAVFIATRDSFYMATVSETGLNRSPMWAQPELDFPVKFQQCGTHRFRLRDDKFHQRVCDLVSRQNSRLVAFDRALRVQRSLNMVRNAWFEDRQTVAFLSEAHRRRSIDRLRDRHGRPEAEPRHPDIS